MANGIPRFPSQRDPPLAKSCPCPQVKPTLLNSASLPGGPEGKELYLQCTTMGPASGGLQVFTLLRKARKGVGYSGTPWSGHAVNWNCRTSRFSLEPFCRAGAQGQGQQHPNLLGCGCTGATAQLQGPQQQGQLTLCREKVRTQNVASSMVSSRVTWIIP